MVSASVCEWPSLYVVFSSIKDRRSDFYVAQICGTHFMWHKYVFVIWFYVKISLTVEFMYNSCGLAVAFMIFIYDFLLW